jgi:hypothetical protein
MIHDELGAPAPAAEIREEKPTPEPAPADAPNVVLAPSLWLDPDVRWLTGVHEVEGHVYLVRERYEELLWWMLMPSLLKIAGEASPDRAAVTVLSCTIDDALATAEAVGYRVDKLLRAAKDEDEVEAEPAKQVEPPLEGEVDSEAATQDKLEVDPASSDHLGE